MLSSFIRLTISALLLGGIYASLSIGLSLTYGVSKLLNAALGSFFLVGVFFTYYLYIVFEWSYLLSILFSLCIVFVLGSIIYGTAIFRSRKRQLDVFVITLSVAMLLQELVRMIWVTSPKLARIAYISLPKIIGGSTVILGVNVSNHGILISLISVAMVSTLWMFLNKTMLGKAFFATSQNEQAAMAVGIDVDRICFLSFVIGCVFSAASGILVSSIWLVDVQFAWEPLTIALSVIVLAGLGSIGGSIIAAFILAMVEIYVSYIFGSLFSPMVRVILIMLVLILRPVGIFGKEK